MTILNVSYDGKEGSYHAIDSVTGVENTEPRQIMMHLAHKHNQVLYMKNKKWRRALLSKIQPAVSAPADASPVKA